VLPDSQEATKLMILIARENVCGVNNFQSALFSRVCTFTTVKTLPIFYLLSFIGFSVFLLLERDTFFENENQLFLMITHTIYWIEKRNKVRLFFSLNWPNFAIKIKTTIGLANWRIVTESSWVGRDLTSLKCHVVQVSTYTNSKQFSPFSIWYGLE